MSENEIMKKTLANILHYVDKRLEIGGQQTQELQHIKQMILSIVVGDDTEDGIAIEEKSI